MEQEYKRDWKLNDIVLPADMNRIEGNIENIETEVTQHLAQNDIHVTMAEKTAWNAKSDFSGNYNDLSNKPTIPSLNNTVTSTSTTQAATANAVKTSYDLANGKYTKPTTGIPQSDLTADLQTSINKIATIDTTVSQHLEQYEYQIAVVSGTQIKLEKQSTSNRLIFKLDSDLSGSITVSTDDGATSKNLVDIDGTPVTSIEKGFHEIVLTGNFFILRNKGGLSKADLEALITITNEAEANESVLRSNYVNAVNAADENINLPSTATWNDILLQIPNIKASNKRWASGSIATIPPNGTVNVTGLPFVPSAILVWSIYNTTNAPDVSFSFVYMLSDKKSELWANRNGSGGAGYVPSRPSDNSFTIVSPSTNQRVETIWIALESVGFFAI